MQGRRGRSESWLEAGKGAPNAWPLESILDRTWTKGSRPMAINYSAGACIALNSCKCNTKCIRVTEAEGGDPSIQATL
jgi:hypothetical protein